MSALAWQDDTVVVHHPAGAYVLTSAGSRLLRGRAVLPVLERLRDGLSRPVERDTLLASVPAERRGSFDRLLGDLERAGAIVPAGRGRPDRSVGRWSRLTGNVPPAGVHLVVARGAEALGDLVRTCLRHLGVPTLDGQPEAAADRPTIAVHPAGAVSRPSGDGHDLVQLDGGLWWLPPTVTVEDLLQRYVSPGPDDGRTTRRAGDVPLAAVAQLVQGALGGPGGPSGAVGRRVDLHTLATTDHAVLPVAGPGGRAVTVPAAAHQDDTAFSRAAAAVCDDRTGPCGRADEGGLQQSPWQLSCAPAHLQAGSVLTAAGHGADLAGARVEAVRGALLLHAVLGVAPGARPRTVRGTDAAGRVLADVPWEAVEGAFRAGLPDGGLVLDPPAGFAHGTSWEDALGRAARSLALAHLLGGPQPTGRRVAEDVREAGTLALLSGGTPVVWDVDAGPDPVAAVAAAEVAVGRAVYAAAPDSDSARQAAVRRALLWHQSRIRGNEAVVVASHRAPVTVHGGVAGAPPAGSLTELWSRLTAGRPHVVVPLDHDAAVARSFPHRLGVVPT